MSRIITERITITLHTDLEKLGRFRGATADKKEMLNDGRLLDAGQQSLTQADLTDAIREVNAAAVAEVTLLRSQLDSLSGLTQERDQLASQVETLQAEIDELKNPPNPPMPTATLSQIRVWLLRNLGVNAIKQVDAMIAAIPDPLEKLIAFQQWEYANHVLRDNPFVLLVQQQLGMTDEQMDAAYLAATEIV